MVARVRWAILESKAPLSQRVEMSKSKARFKERLIYEGSVGRCPCCDKPTKVRLAGTLGIPDPSDWIVPLEVLELLYRSVASRIRTDKKTGKPYVTDPSEYDATRRVKVFFVDGEDGIAGPFGPLGLKVFLGSHSEHTTNVRVYVVSTSSSALEVIRKSPFARDRETSPQIGTTEDLF